MAYVLHRTIGPRVVLNQIRGETLRIGRGTNADLRSEDATVALEHAVIEHGVDGYVLVDRGSITGTYLNGKPVESATLRPGDVIEIGSLRMRVQVADPAQPLFLKVEAIAPEARPAEIGAEAATSVAVDNKVAEGRETVVAPKVDYVRAYQLRGSVFTKTTVAAVFVAAAAASILGIVHDRKETAFRPGGLSSAHTTMAIAANCSACHDPWKGVSDQKCSACHAGPQHTSRQTVTPSCTTCHAEHRQLARLQLVDDSTCTRCHANLSVSDGVPQFARSITSFGGHPEFALTLGTAGAPRRVRLTSPLARQADTTELAFNHRKHLGEDVRNAYGQLVRLACQDCHSLVQTGGQVEPQKLSFASHCQSCHLLTFDQRFADAEVPHGGEPELVYSAILGVYSGSAGLIGRSPTQARRLLSRPASGPPSAEQQALYAAEQVLKGKCAKCHELRRSEQRLTVIAPQFRSRWFPHAEFRHRPHLGIACEQCHDASASSRTADVLMPSIATCQECHGRTKLVAAGIALAVSGPTSSDCVTCHFYHQRSREGWEITPLRMPIAPSSPPRSALFDSPWALLIALVVALFLAALFLELRRRRGEHPAEAPAPQPPSPGKRATPEEPAAPQTAVRTEAPPEPTGVVPMAGGTMHMDLGQQPAGGTEMIQWYGTLRWTSGPLMGQKLPIPVEGFWIGRDGDLSQIVIDDSRVSRKHVWVGPREGKIQVLDEGSTNGTYLNSTQSQRITETELKPGDQVIIGEGVASFEYIP